MRRSFFILAAALVVAPLVAQAAAPAWIVDQGKSTLGFTGTQTGTKFHGKFQKFSADIAFSPTDLAGSHIDVTVDLASAATGDAQRDTALPGKDWFDIAKLPRAVFKSSAITKTGADAYQAVGTLTLRGVSQQVNLPFHLVISGATAHATGQVTLVRTAYGVGQGPWKSGDYVGLDVIVTVDITASRGR